MRLPPNIVDKKTGGSLKLEVRRAVLQAWGWKRIPKAG